MSSGAPADTGDAKKSSRRRRTPGSRRRGSGDAAKKGDAPAAKADAAPVERKPRPESIPVPASMIGKKQTGRVTAIVKKGRLRFGFIHIGPADGKEEELPRIYFSFADVADPEVTIRNKYLVEFECKNDEKGRAFASGVALTAAGKIAAAEREVEFAARKAASEAQGTAEKPKKERAPRERKPKEERLVELVCSCEGINETKTMEVNCNASVGKLKNVVTAAFDAPLTHNVFHITAEEPKGVFLTKAIMNKLAKGDKVHLGAPVADAASA